MASYGGAGPAGDGAARVLDGRVLATDADAWSLRVGIDGSGREVHEVLERLADAHIEAATVGVTTATLDDVFLALTGHPTSPTEVPRP